MRNTICSITEDNRLRLENGCESALVQYKRVGDGFIVARSHLINTGSNLRNLTSGITKNNHYIEICEEL